MKYSVISASDLTPDLASAWVELQQSSGALSSPYFRHEFTAHVAQVRSDVRIAVLEDGNRVVGFFPHQRRWDRTARPVGLRLSDYHGVIAQKGADWDAIELMRSCGIVRWAFDHVPADQRQFKNWATLESNSPLAQVCDGFDAFQARLDKAGRKQIREAERKRIRLDTEIGPVRYVRQTLDPNVLNTLMRWKSEQCLRSGGVDYFAIPWCRTLLEMLHHTQTQEFGGMLSCLYAGDVLVAAHFTLYSRRVWHSWFPGYDVSYGAFSPGSILLLALLMDAASSGVQHVDFGKDMSRYKRRYMTHAIPLVEGCVELPSLLNFGSRVRCRIETWSRASTLRPLLRYPGRIIKGFERRHRYD